jgi:hypothetical protein
MDRDGDFDRSTKAVRARRAPARHLCADHFDSMFASKGAISDTALARLARMRTVGSAL